MLLRGKAAQGIALLFLLARKDRLFQTIVMAWAESIY
jgi:hypothetical protein